MVKVKKSVGSADVPRMDILAARLKVVEAKLELEAKEVNLDDGRSFVADPNLSLKFVVEANLVDPGIHEGASFYDRFKLKQNEDGDWVIAKFSKLGNLVGLRYGESWFEDENAGIDEDDFVD